MCRVGSACSRIGLALVLIASVLCSAGCGCGSGVASPPLPDRYYDNPYHRYDHYDYGDPWRSGDYYYYDRDYNRYVSWSYERPLREVWLTGASYVPEMQHHRVYEAWQDDTQRFGQLVFEPDSSGGWPAESELDRVAYAIYGAASSSLDEPLWIELDWAEEPAGTDNIWVGVRRRSGGRWWWNWFQPDPYGRVQLWQLDDYRGEDFRETLYVALLVSGYEPGVLDGIALRSYRQP